MSQEEQTIKLDQRDVLDAAMTAGHILLENGAEIFRVEETIDLIILAYSQKTPLYSATAFF